MSFLRRFPLILPILFLFFFFFSLCLHRQEGTFKYKVLLLGSDKSKAEKDYTSLIEEMLLSWNIPYEKINNSRLSKEIFLKNGKFQFTTVIVTKNFDEFEKRELKLLKRFSHNYGISIVSFFSFIDERGKEIFGLEEVSKDKLKSIAIKMRKREDFLCGDFNLNENFLGKELIKLKTRKAVVILESKRIPVFLYYRYGKGFNYYFNISPEAWKITDGKVVFLRRAIFKNSGNGFIYFGLEGVCALRCDDPLRNIAWEDDQSYQKFYYRRMGKKDWEELLKVLKKHDAGMSLAVVTGFKDDGDRRRGEIYVNGEKVERRICGRIYDSKDVKYVFNTREKKGVFLDYEEEFEGLKYALENYKNLDIQQHGFVHLNPDLSWCNATDKYTNFLWGVEFYNGILKGDVSEDLQKIALEEGYNRILKWFKREPIIFVPPGLLVSGNSQKILKDFGYKYYFDKFTLKKLVNGNYRDLSFVPVVPIKEIEWGVYPSYIRSFSTLPTILGLHDVDFTYFGIDWFDNFLSLWRKSGVRKFISLGALLNMLSTKIDAEFDGEEIKLNLDISEASGPKNLDSSRFFSDKEMILNLKLPERWVEKLGEETVEIVIPPFKERVAYKENIILNKLKNYRFSRDLR
ncbi:MAG: hypothetical protein ACUVUG_00115 [Candidatus Aminicenantia bacterium]